MRPFRRWSPWMQQVMICVLVALVLVSLARCAIDMIGGHDGWRSLGAGRGGRSAVG